jgi:vacuolar protein sorting-associated protein 13A/C
LTTLGIETISLDKDYERERQQKQIREQPKHVGEGLLFGARDLGKGLFKGVTGLVEEPMKGAKKEGAEGFFKGLGIGVIGLAARPVMGVMDLATQTTKGIRNTTTMFDKKVTSRKRPPRYIGPDKVLEPYNREKAEGAELMTLVDDNQFKDDTYLTHIPIGTDRVLLATAQHIIFTKKDDNKLVWAEDVQSK